MGETITVTAEELASLKEKEIRFERLTILYGQLHFQAKIIETEKKNVEEDMTKLDSDRLSLIDVLEKKYGKGSVDMSTGVFTPIPLQK